MTEPYYADDAITLHHGDTLATLRTLPDESVNCCVTSPPYYGLRDYGNEGQYGLESSPAAYVDNMRAVFAEVRRVLAKDGTLWLNIGDSYSAQGGGKAEGQYAEKRVNGATWQAPRTPPVGVPAKNLLGIPWRTAFALQDDGWILRNAIVWAKPNAMPESVTDRLSTRHELLFMFSRSRKYWFDLDPIREPVLYPGDDRSSRGQAVGHIHMSPATRTNGHENGRNPGDVWTIPTTPFPGAHFAVFPPEIPRRAILAGCKPGGTVLDPFSGSGTTGMVAGQLGRKYVGIDLSEDYLRLSLETRLAQTALLDGESA